jgi:hypothetical protein
MQRLRVRGVQCGADYDTRRKRPPRAFGEDTDKAAYLHGDRVGRRMALHYRVSAPGLLERPPRDSVVAVLSWSPLQLPGALIRRGRERNKPAPVGIAALASHKALDLATGSNDTPPSSTGELQSSRADSPELTLAALV